MTFLISSRHFRSNPHHEFEKYFLKKSVWWRCAFKIGNGSAVGKSAAPPYKDPWKICMWFWSLCVGSPVSSGFGFEGTVETSKWHQSWNSLNCCLTWHQTRELCTFPMMFSCLQKGLSKSERVRKRLYKCIFIVVVVIICIYQILVK